MTILNYDKHRIVMFVSVCNSMDVLGQQVVCPDIVPCEWASNTSRLVNTLKSSSLCICFFFSALFSISQWYFSISKKRRQQKKKTAKEEGSKRRIQQEKKTNKRRRQQKKKTIKEEYNKRRRQQKKNTTR